MRLRASVYRILQPAPPDERGQGRIDRLSRTFDLALMALIALNVVAISLESVADIRHAYGIWLAGFELVSVLIFTLEYALRLWSAVEGEPGAHPLRARLRFALSPLALVDLLVILPYYLAFLFAVDLRALRVLRLLWVLKLTRYSASMALLLDVLREEMQPILAALSVLFLMLMIAASLAWLAEHQAQPEAFASIPKALWWAVVTMTTLGYGDVVPVTPVGRLIGGAIAIIGVGMVALPAGLLASGFSEHLHRRRRRFEAEADRLVRDGHLTPADRQHLQELSDRLGLSDLQAAEILRIAERRSRTGERTCPHCGKPLPPS